MAVRILLELSRKTLMLIDHIFRFEDREEAANLLKLECTDNLPFISEQSTSISERIIFAALKLSDGNIDHLVFAIETAQKDWRDLLVYAGFAEKINEHEIWAENLLATIDT